MRYIISNKDANISIKYIKRLLDIMNPFFDCSLTEIRNDYAYAIGYRDWNDYTYFIKKHVKSDDIVIGDINTKNSLEVFKNLYGKELLIKLLSLDFSVDTEYKDNGVYESKSIQALAMFCSSRLEDNSIKWIYYRKTYDEYFEEYKFDIRINKIYIDILLNQCNFYKIQYDELSDNKVKKFISNPNFSIIIEREPGSGKTLLAECIILKEIAKNKKIALIDVGLNHDGYIDFPVLNIEKVLENINNFDVFYIPEISHDYKIPDFLNIMKTINSYKKGFITTIEESIFDTTQRRFYEYRNVSRQKKFVCLKIDGNYLDSSHEVYGFSVTGDEYVEI